MVRGVKKAIMALAMVMMLAVPALVEAAEKIHWFQCGDCHRYAGGKPWELTGVCARCHPDDTTNWSKIVAGEPLPVPTPAPGNFDISDASNAFGSHYLYNSATAMETSHFWASTTDNMPAAGAEPPLNDAFNTTTVSKGKVTCSRCHDPHAFDDNPKQLKIDNSRDQMCKDCHRGWNISNNSGLETHPLIDDFDAALGSPSINPAITYNSVTGLLSTNVNQGAVRVVYNSVTSKFMVSCTSCHGVHYTDSDSVTPDGRDNRSGLNKGDGKILRTDGALKTVTPYNNANSILQAQIRSNLCQACHTYQTHGKVGYEPNSDLDAVDEQVGCLDCHSGHSYNGGTQNYFVLRNTVSTGSYGADKTTLYTTNPTSWETYCTSCHGPVSGFPTTLRTHTTGENCKGCHAHDAAYSFAMGDNATICGDCHGAPPRDNATTVVRSDNNLTPPSYAVGPNAGTGDDYIGDADYKDETRTPHKIHAGALNADKAVVDYAFGSTASGLVSACLPCHNDQADTVTPTHDTGTSTGSFRDIYFSPFATYNGVITGQAYPSSGGSAWKCSNVYCHSNGGKRNATGTKVAVDFTTTQTPAWALGSNPGTIVGTGTECQWCHGENIATMAVAAKNNSQTHNRHLTKLNGGLNNKTTCYICHSSTVDATGVVPAAARDIRNGGTHVNGSVEVIYNSTALGGALSTGSYTGGASGTCSVYCHNPSTLDTAGGTFDWDNYTGAALACDACHEGLATDSKPIATGSHARHIAAAGANVKCDSCHGAGAAAGTHSGHVDGVVTKLTTAASCDVCHGVENTAAWDVTPTWGLSTSVDCRTCHVDSVGGGNSVTSYVDNSSVTRQVTAANSLDKSNFSAKGHGKTGVAKVCTECHDSAYSATHMNATTGDNRLQVLSGQNYGVSVNGFCAVCHVATTNTHFDNSQTPLGNSVSGTTCNICHNPHGQVGNTMDAMIVNSIGGRTVSGFADRNVRGSYFIDPPSAAGYGICQVCHDPNAPDALLHFNWNIAEPLHQDATNTVKCIQCHSHSNTPGFQKSGDSCESCHAAKVAEPRHAAHVRVVPDITSDRSDCALCHPNVASYTTSGGHLDHMTGSTNLVGTIVVNDGGTGKTTCASVACHGSGTADGFWQDTDGLNCTACHNNGTNDGNLGNAVSSTAHNKHLTAGMVCSACHTGFQDPAPGNSLNGPLSHIDATDISTDALRITTKGKDHVNATGTDPEVDDSAYDSVNTWVNSAVTNDGGNSCSNTNCHDPSNNSTTADWDTGNSTGNCAFCHGYGTTMASGSHSLHLNNAAVIGDNFACTVCHPDNTALGTDHTLDVSNTQGVVTVAGSKANTYGGEVNLPNTAYGTCTASQCHNDGKGSNVPSPQWNRTPQPDDCTICHGAPPNTGDHGNGSIGHWQATRTGLGLECKSCHASTAATNTSIQAGSLHLNGNSYNVVGSGATPQYNGANVTIVYNSAVSPSNCTASCHGTNPRNWAAAASCEGCHDNPPASGAHLKHTTVTFTGGSWASEDRTDCDQCHPGASTYTLSAVGTHQDTGLGQGLTTLNASIVNATGGNYTCNALCHNSSVGNTDWVDSNGAACDVCHYYDPAPTSGGNTGHSSSLTNTHNAHFAKSKVCTDCHALADGSIPTPGPLSHITASGANEGAILAGKAQALRNEATLTFGGATSYTYAYGAADAGGPNSTCSSPTNNGLGCHASGTADWDVAITTCTACHTAENLNAVSGNLSDPYSGLHKFSTATRHDDTLLSGNCINCHDATSPSTTHQNGTRDSWSAVWTFNATNGVSYNSATGCAANASCHMDGGDWNRVWNTAVDAIPLATDDPASADVCGNCHGTFFKGWNGVTTSHVDPDPDNPGDGMSNHSTCETCHGWGNGNYNAVWLGSYNATYVGHGDANITMNGPVGTGTGYNNTTGGCDTSNCHGAFTLTMATTNSWGTNINYGEFGAGGACDVCHGGAGQYWPDNVQTSYILGNRPDNAGVHEVHMKAISQQLYSLTTAGLIADAASDVKQKAICVYCHYAAVEAGEGGHNDAGTPASMANSDGNGNFMKYLIGGSSDADGTFNSGVANRTCSNIACHADAAETPHWYGDNELPGAVTIAAFAGTEPGSVKLTWIAAGDDASRVGTAYRFDVRYKAGSITSGTFDTDPEAGGLAVVDRQGKPQEMVVRGLAAGTSYNFAVKVYDEASNASVMSNVESRAANDDTTVPTFWGIETATAADEAGVVLLTWNAAEDHSMPITYHVYWDTGVIDYDNSGVLDSHATTSGTSFRITGLPVGVLYNFAVRATDSATVPKTDGNTFVKQAMAATPPTVAKVTKSYYANGASGALSTGGFTSTGSSTAPFNFVAATAYTAATNVFGDSFKVYVDNGNSASVLRAELGYDNGAFQSFGTPVTASANIASRIKKVVTFKFAGLGGQVPAGSKVAVRFTVTSGAVDSIAWGSATNQGLLVIDEQLANFAPTGGPGTPAVTGAAGIVTVNWTAANDSTDGVADTVHYDVYGSDDGGATYRYRIATNLPAATTSVQWNTLVDGIGLAVADIDVRVRVDAGDGYTHTTGATANLTIDNTTDTVKPSAVTDLAVEQRPKAGTVYLTWTAPGDDLDNNGRAQAYDIRYSTANIANDTDFNNATQASHEPYPDFGGTHQGYELTGLVPATTYWFAIKTRDENAGNWSALSNVVSIAGGPKCGICHATPPNEASNAGNHAKHGFTVNDCDKCHNDGVTPVATYTTAHQDGVLKFGFGPSGASSGTAGAGTITYYDGATKIYEDLNGVGGFNASGVTQVDNGTCMNFAGLGVGGCHGPATPSWDAAASLSCSACHGTAGRTVDTYGRDYDGTVANGGTVPDQIKAAPPIDNHGLSAGKYTGQHEKHLNYSFRYSKSDSCAVCHGQGYVVKGSLPGEHADSSIDIQLDPSAAGAGANWTPGAGATPGTCSNLSDTNCHPSASTPQWDSAQNFECVQCHGFGGVTPSHTTDTFAGISVDNDPTNTNDGGPMPGNCTWCHYAGHPQGAIGGSIVIPNNPAVGINYKGGGIHLRASIGLRAAAPTEAELCWGCHDSNGISEWGTNTKAATGSSPYNYGTVNSGTSAKWVASPGVGATWVSGTAAFGYKTAAIQSTHTTNPAGSSAVTGSAYAYTESPDAVGLIRCSNCHDVHNRNLAPGDATSGQPYLRGSWLSNPYKEDGAPQSGTNYTAATNFGAVPRGGTGYTQTGGYYIDQNSGYPTAGYSLSTSAGLCTLCHGTDVNIMDQTTDASNLWVGSLGNGHSNAAIGGTGVNASDILNFTQRHGAAGSPLTYTGSGTDAGNPSMGYQNAADYSASVRGYGFRSNSNRLDGWDMSPYTLADFSYTAFNWGVAQDNGTIDTGYHAFSCSKCHNPHASRLPKLMITNCLDTKHNTWDNVANLTLPATGTFNNTGTDTLSSANGNKTASNWSSAQNCHRYGDPGQSGLGAGWNKVTPWQ